MPTAQDNRRTTGRRPSRRIRCVVATGPPSPHPGPGPNRPRRACDLDYPEVLDRLADGLDPLADLHRPPAVLAADGGGAAVRSERRPAIRVTHRAPHDWCVRPRRRRDRTDQRDHQLVGVCPPISPARWSWNWPRQCRRFPVRTHLPGGTRWELKFDGFRAALVRTSDTVRIWSEQNGYDRPFCSAPARR